MDIEYKERLNEKRWKDRRDRESFKGKILNLGRSEYNSIPTERSCYRERCEMCRKRRDHQ